MRVCHNLSASFDDPNLVSCAGLIPVMALAGRAGLHDLAAAHVRVPGSAGANPGVKVAALVAGMVAGADSIDDMDLLRHGGMDRVFTAGRAPSTLGTFLRAFTFGHVRQLDAVACRVLVNLAEQSPLLVGADQVAYLDIDDTIKATYGHKKQGAGYGYSKVKGLNALLAAVSTPVSAPVIAATRLRRGATNSAKGAARLVADALVTAGRAITQIPEDDWVGITYPHAIYDEDENRWISDAQVAEIGFTAFTSRRRSEHISARLIVRRVKRLGPKSGPTGQGELFSVWRHHAVFTDSAESMLAAEATHRDHAIVEQTFSDLKAGPLAHMPSGSFSANGAWTVLAAIAFNLTRATGTLASKFHAMATTATIRAQLITVPGRIARSARRLRLHLPRQWPWEHAWQAMFTAAGGPNARCGRARR